jgi:TolB-like protein
MSLASGSKLGHYDIVGALGAGGMGEVYLARDSKLGREVALKVLPQELASDPERLARLEREARTVAALNHPNIVTLHAVEDSGGTTFLVMERVIGRALTELIPPGGMTVDRLIEIAGPIADALSAAHDKSIVHRDLKPANVMVTDDGLVKVLDFGLARVQPARSPDGEAGAATVTQTLAGQVVGTVPYMAPEQLRGEPVDARADIFAFGTMLYEMATGRRPFRGDSTADVMSAILREEPRPIDQARPGLPPRLVRLVTRCLEKNPRRRVQSAIDLRHELDDLEEELRGLPAAAAGPTVSNAASAAPAQGGARTASSKAWRRGAILAASVAGVAIVAIGLILFSKSGGSTPGGDGAIKSLAVLPFDNVNRDASQDYFVDGMHEALITDLVKLGTLKVMSRNAVLKYRGKATGMKQIASELGVEALIEGSVLRAGNQVRITAQLILGKTDQQVWGTSYDRDLQDVLKLLNDVSRAIAGEVRSRLGGAAVPAPRIDQRELPRVLPDAYDAYLRGRQLMFQGRLENMKAALDQFRQATDLDPAFAPAWGSMAAVQVMYVMLGMPQTVEAVAEARRLSQKALELDPNDGAGLAVKGTLQLYADWNFSEAKITLERAVELNPHDAILRHGLADYLMTIGRFDESLEQVKLGRDANPTLAMPETMVIFHTMATRRFDEVIAEGRRALTLFPSLKVSASSLIADALWQQKRFDEAVAESKIAFGANPALWRVFEDGYKHGGPAGAMRAYADYWAKAAPGARNAVAVAGAYADAGDRGKAMEWLEKAFVARVPTLIHVVATPSFDDMHGDPRYQDLLRRIGISSATK